MIFTVKHQHSTIPEHRIERALKMKLKCNERRAHTPPTTEPQDSDEPNAIISKMNKRMSERKSFHSTVWCHCHLAGTLFSILYPPGPTSHTHKHTHRSLQHSIFISFRSSSSARAINVWASKFVEDNRHSSERPIVDAAAVVAVAAALLALSTIKKTVMPRNSKMNRVKYKRKAILKIYCPIESKWRRYD